VRKRRRVKRKEDKREKLRKSLNVIGIGC